MDELLNKSLSERLKQQVRKINKKKITKKKIEVFKCSVCSKEFGNKYNLQVHTQTHSATKPYSCELCPYRGISRKYLSRHVKKVHLEPSNHKCEICGKMYHYHCQLKYHMLVHTGEKPFKCLVCGKAFNSRYTLSTHKYIHTNEKPYQCVFCEYACRDGSTLRKHQDRHMGLEKMYQCKMCETRCKSKIQLKHHVAEKHLNIDIRKHPCPHCVKRFKDKGTLTSHIKQVHDKAKACACEICGARISNKGNLMQHMRTHVDVRPYKCVHEGCQIKFKDPSSLAKHVKRHRGILRERLYCADCGDSFKNKTSIINHIRRVHDRNRKQYICDICSLVSLKKRRLIKHLKYAHISERETQCKICKKTFRKPYYLKMHYKKTHGVKYSTLTHKQLLHIIKEEPDDTASIDLFEIEKHELLDDLELTQIENTDVDQNTENLNQYEDLPISEISENAAKNIIENHRQILKRVPEAIFDQFYIDHVMKSDVKVSERKPKEDIEIDKNKEEYVRKCIKKLLVEVRRKKEAIALEKARKMYNDRILAAVKNAPKIGPMKIKYFNNNKIKTNISEDTSEENKQEINDDESLNKNDESLNKSDEALNKNDESLNKHDESLNKHNESLNKNDESINNESQNTDALNTRSLNNESQDSEALNNELLSDNDKRSSTERSKNDEGRNKKVIFNTHQCYVCFKLFETKQQLVEHCKDHFDICSNTSLTKCPLCDYATKTGLTRHIRLKHNVHIKLPYGNLKDKNDNTNGSRYYYEINDAKIKQIEVIPSVNNLNKMAAAKIDKKKREDNDKVVAKTKLVKKGGNWLVEKEKIDVNVDGIVLPKFDSTAVKNVKVRNKYKDSSSKINDNSKGSGNNSKINEYLEGMKKLYHAAKKNGKKIMFPCQNCDKICQSLAALKLHVRKHDPNAKPFKPKVWKHKLEKLGTEKRDTETRIIKPNLKHRTEKPKPIVNRHNCDPELMKFYENNIRGGDIEFWQFLKIFNRMGRENITEFRDLEDRTDFGIHVPNKNEVPDKIPEDKVPEDKVPKDKVPEDKVPNDKVPEDKVPEDKVPKKVPNVIKTKTFKTKNRNYKRVIRLSKREYIKRNNIKNKLREKIAKESQNI